MRYLFVLFILMSLSFTANANQLKTEAGKIPYSLMSKAISKELNAHAIVTNARSSLNPLDVVTDPFSSSSTYVIKFDINNMHKVTCTMFVVDETSYIAPESILIHECKSKTVRINSMAFDYAEFGLKKKSEIFQNESNLN